MGPYQPKLRVYPKTTFGTSNRQFNPEWFNAPNSAWLEYSIDDDAIFCLCCYLFKNEFESRGNAGKSFTQDGFKNWNHGPERIRLHVGEVNSIHNKCLNRMLDFANQRQSIQSSLHKQSEKTKSDYRIRLNASINVVRFLLRNGLPFRGHDESEDSDYKGLFLELLKFHGVNRPDVEKVILQHAPKNDMQFKKKLWIAIIKDLDGDYFGILVDESKGISHKEQIALVLRYVNKNGELIECFLGIVHVGDTSARSLQKGLLRQHQVEKLEELLKSGEILTGQGLNQEHGLQRLGDTRWVSHFKTLENFMIIFSSIANVLKDMKENSPHDLDKLAADVASYNELNKALQKIDQDIVNAMGLLNLSKRRLQTMRESGLESLMDEVSSFCGKQDILVPEMTEDYPRSKRKKSEISYLHHFRVEVFYAVIDLQLQELNNRFDVVTSDLLLGMASLNPVDSFANFSKRRIMKLAEYYKSEFGDSELRDLSYQLDSFIVYA
ncbi:uncharacterized protein LOC125850719 [Solanum stenotomum]|uniref:uncharacterized protein LOC125850719 n=1 Tax=Solanum stenotomum TaxID=172797 RepID=UPI0020D024D4|nr:uncharacterized protein LOC125850719 [Solanum stenotomum]